MPKLNFAQDAPDHRDVGGISSTTVLTLALGICLIWALLIHFQVIEIGGSTLGSQFMNSAVHWKA